MAKEIIVLDTETTGVNAREDSLIEIAAAKVVDGRVTARFQTLVKPIKTPLNTTVSVLTGIKPEDLVDAPDISEIKDKLLEFVGELPITGHNISFDLDFLKANDIDPLGHSLDTLDLVIAVLPKLPYHSMQFLAQYFQLPTQPSHRAMDDVLATADLINVVVKYIKNLPSPVLKNVQEVLAKSDWEWSWIFDAPNWQAPAISSSSSWPSPGSYKILDASTERTYQNDVVKNIQPGLNLFELPPDIPQIPANIALATGDKQSVLVMSNVVFNQTDWSSTKLNPQFGLSIQLDPDRFKFLLDKPKLKSTEARLFIKVLLTGYPAVPFSPGSVYLTKDEYYLWEQKLAPFQFAMDKLPSQTVINFSTLWEILENNTGLLKDRTIYLPQWLEFTDWSLFKSVKIFTDLYLHAAVSSRRDYVHDFITDNKAADEMFKLLNNFGVQINSLWGAIGQLWQEEGGDKTIEISNLLNTTKAGKEVIKYAKQSATTLEKFLAKIQSTTVVNLDASARQIEHTQKLLGHLQYLIGGSENKIYVEGYLGRIKMYIVKLPLANIWQKLKDFKIVVASNGLLANGSGDFMINTFDEPVSISGLANQRVGSSPAKGRLGGDDEVTSTQYDKKKFINIVKSLPDRKAPDYEDKVFDYLRQNLQPNEKVMVVFSNNAQVGVFFEKYYHQIPGVDLISYNVAGNSEILSHTLTDKSSFVFLASNSSLPKYTKSVNQLDRVIFLTLPFDPPGTLGQVLAATKLKNDFTDYSLPRATLKFKQLLADLHDKTNEFWILDSRLINADWANPILSSLTGFSVQEK